MTDRESLTQGSPLERSALREMQTVLDHAKRGVEAADRAELAAQQAAEHARSFAKAIAVVVGALAAVVLIAVATRQHR
jgi:ferric-dicitrate binding protein FerR (iron transport regulator)